MKCDLSHSRLHGYFDGELSTSEAPELERHLLGCTDCGAELVELDLLRDRLRLARLYESAPGWLKRRIREDIGVSARAGVSPSLPWHWFAAAALILIGIALWKLSPELRKNDYQAELADEIVDAHLRSLQPGHLTGVNSNDKRVVREWFENTLKFSVPVRDFVNDGFSLLGARVDAIEGRPFAALVYKHDRHLIDLFIWPTREPDSSPRPGSRKGYRWLEWRKGETDFCAVSDADVADLNHIQGLISD